MKSTFDGWLELDGSKNPTCGGEGQDVDRRVA